jgi:hypothetical protein
VDDSRASSRSSPPPRQALAHRALASTRPSRDTGDHTEYGVAAAGRTDGSGRALTGDRTSRTPRRPTKAVTIAPTSTRSLANEPARTAVEYCATLKHRWSATVLSACA